MDLRRSAKTVIRYGDFIEADGLAKGLSMFALRQAASNCGLNTQASRQGDNGENFL
jgi:hypothetical protein